MTFRIYKGGTFIIILESYLANAQVFKVSSIVSNKSLIAILKKTKKSTTPILCQIALKEPLKIFFFFLQYYYLEAFDEVATPSCRIARAPSFHLLVPFVRLNLADWTSVDNKAQTKDSHIS